MKLICETERLVLKVLQSGNAEEVLSFYANNKEFFEPWDPRRNENFYTLPYHQSSLTCEFKQILHLKALRYWIFQKNNSDIIGTVSCSNIIRGAFSTCQVGYKLDKNYCKRGFAYEAMKELISVIFNELGLHRIEANIMPNNYSSIILAQKLGFNNEGMCVDSIQINGNWESHYRYALINKALKP